MSWISAAELRRQLDPDRFRNMGPDQERKLLDRTRRAAFVMVALSIIGWLIVGANTPSKPRLVPPTGHVREAGVSIFGATSFTVQAGSGLTANRKTMCALLASTSAQQEAGMMDQTSFHGYSGLVFAYPRPTDPVFYMQHTTLALSIAWFDSGGNYIASENMAPCPLATSECATYQAGQNFKWALEVPKGHLAALGIGNGSVLQLNGPCTG
jgi:uncharacterized membrane protein (UPF0127 family)